MLSKLLKTLKIHLKKQQQHTLLKQATPHDRYEGSEIARGNFRKFLYQFQTETKTLIRKHEGILNKLYR